MWRLILIVGLLTLAGCNQGSPYAFRLMAPPTNGVWADYVPYWFWEEIATFATWRECKAERQTKRTAYDARRIINIEDVEEEGFPDADDDDARSADQRDRLIEHFNRSGKEAAKRLLQMARQARARCVPLR